jgi:1-deoxy-D-xylulose-5-phosphate reductoisomerase
MNTIRNVVILGSTGSIGRSTLEVISSFRDRFNVLGLSANSNIELLLEQVREFKPKFVCISNREKASDFKEKLKTYLPKDKTRSLKVFEGQEDLGEMVRYKDTDLVVVAISGMSALFCLLEAIRAKKEIALANKEAMVAAGDVIMKEAKENAVKIIPIDSEASAIWQCLQNHKRDHLKKIYITCSGGPLNDIPKKEFKNITKKRVLSHPKWKMGRKISVDSATLMNKGLELIEIRCLFGIDISQIEVIIHKEAIIHSMVEFCDGTIFAQLAIPDMRIPIQYALSYPERWENAFHPIDFSKLKSLTFSKPDLEKFPCLEMAFEAAKKGGTFPCVLNASNEEVVWAFLNGRIDFIDIPEIIEKVLSKHRGIKNPNLEQLLEQDIWAREETKKLIP